MHDCKRYLIEVDNPEHPYECLVCEKKFTYSQIQGA